MIPLFSSLTEAARLHASDLLSCVSKDAEVMEKLKPAINFTKHFPLFSGNMLEMHNDRADQWFDFCFRINSRFDSHLLTEIPLISNIPAVIRNGYKQILNEPAATFRFGLDNLWFEYDHPNHAEPSLFMDIEKIPGDTLAEKYSALKHITDIFLYPCSPQLEAFLALLNENDLTPIFLGCMFTRNSQPIRLTIKDLQPGMLVHTLQNIGWHGNADLLEFLEKNYIKPDNKLLLDIDFTTELGAKIGIEIYYCNQHTLIKQFHHSGIYADDQYTFLKDWRGSEILSPTIASYLTGTCQRKIETVYRGINHFKFSLNEEELKTKAYLYYSF